MMAGGSVKTTECASALAIHPSTVRSSTQARATDAPTHSRWLKSCHKTEFHRTQCLFRFLTVSLSKSLRLFLLRSVAEIEMRESKQCVFVSFFNFVCSSFFHVFTVFLFHSSFFQSFLQFSIFHFAFFSFSHVPFFVNILITIFPCFQFFDCPY